MGQEQTFIVRVWSDESERPVRGHVQHVASRRGLYFRDLERMLQFMRDLTPPEENPPGAVQGAGELPSLPPRGEEGA